MENFMRKVVGGLFLVAACADDPALSEEEVAQRSLEEGDEECAALGIEACKSNDDCRVLSGGLIQEAQGCIGERVELGCQSASKGCDDAMTVGHDERGQSWLFNNGCLPQSFASQNPRPGAPGSEPGSWPQCNPQPPPAPLACANLNPDQCERLDCVAIQALAYEPTRICIRGTKNVMCMSRSQGCTGALTYATDPEGQAWQFTSGCQPMGWTEFRPEPAAVPQPSWPGCAN